MGISAARDLDEVRLGFTRWLHQHRPEAPEPVVTVTQPATGLSSETLLLDVDWPGADREDPPGQRSLVARLPPDGDGLFPVYDLSAQGRVQEMVADAGLPAVVPLAVELDPSWVGAPFLLMPRIEGQVVRADTPFLRRGWLAEAAAPEQATLHGGFLDLLAGVHRLEVSDGRFDFVPEGPARATGTTLGAGLERWTQFLSWAAEGDVPAVFADAVAWCGAHLPRPEPPASLLWGDVQLGNVLVTADMTIAAVLDFEMATVGPAEIDFAWFLVLHRMTVERCGGDLPGFPDRAATIAGYERRLGRLLTELHWYEVFAALRSGAIMVRAARLLARLGVDDSWLTRGNPTVTLLEELTGG
ncbi:MAG: phosphotransferase family protein [Acidimicrobiales bacterium]